MNGYMLAFAIVFVLPVTIVGMIIIYKIIRLKHENRLIHNESGNHAPGGPTQESVEELLARAANLQKRVQNLEDIILSDQAEDGAYKT